MAVTARYDFAAKKKSAFLRLESKHDNALAAETKVTQAEQVHTHIVSAEGELENGIGYDAPSGSGGFDVALALLGQQVSREVAHTSVSFPSLFAALNYA